MKMDFVPSFVGNSSETARIYTRWKAKYKVFNEIPKWCHDKFKLGTLKVGESMYFKTIPTEGNKVTVYLWPYINSHVWQYNKNYPVQFKVFKTKDYYEVARIS